MKTDRKTVYLLIDKEREYQDSKYLPKGRPKSDEETPIANWLIYIENQLMKAKDSVYSLNETEAMGYIRKLTALGVACMENNITPSR